MKDALGFPQSVLVLGGNSDIAQATVRELTERRCTRVILGVRDIESASKFIEDMKRRGIDADAVAFDASAFETHREVIDSVFDCNDGIDLVLIAFGVLGNQVDFDENAALAVSAVAVNYTGAVSSGLIVADRMRSQGHGTIVFLSSVAGERARSSNFVYGSSKAGLDAFAQGLGDSLHSSGIRVMVVRPGFVISKMTEGLKPQPFTTTPEAVATAIIRGLERSDEIVWAPRILRFVFSTMRHLPRPLWRLISSRA